MNNTVSVGILGLGVVGAELVNIIKINHSNILKNYGIDLQIKSIFVRDVKKTRTTDISGLNLTSNVHDVINDPEIDIICECIGGSGTELTKDYILSAINNNKSIVMSSKKTLAIYGKQILSLACKKNISFKYDATVGGGVPVAKILTNCFKGEKIEQIVGILNATSNYIYTRMEKDNLSFEKALEKAQELGYAENNPSEDINGYDALYKAVILTLFSSKKWLDVNKLETTPFSSINMTDVKYAEELGYKIKPLAIIENQPNGITYKIGPCLIKENHIVENTQNNFNVIVFKGSNSGMLGFYGQGAGSLPTASAMFDDIVGILTSSNSSHYNTIDQLCSNIVEADNVSEYKNNLYLRINVENKIGRLAFICSILSKNSVNVEKIIQKDGSSGMMDIVFLTSSIESSTINEIINEFNVNGIKIHTLIPFLGE